MSKLSLTWVKNAVNEYLKYLDDDGVRWSLDLRPRERDDTRLHASALASCPVATYYKRREREPTNQVETPLFLFTRGNRMQEVIQEALSWWMYTQEYDTEKNLALPEFEIDTGVYVGRADMFLQMMDAPLIVEIKDSQASRVRESWILQLYAYMRATDATEGVLVWMHYSFIEFFRVHTDSDAIYVEDEHGMHVDANWLPLAIETFDDRLDEHRAYWRDQADHALTPPYMGPFDNWQCMEWARTRTDYGKTVSMKPYMYKRGSNDGQYGPGDTKPGLAQARCPYARECWGVPEGYHEVTLDSDGNYVLHIDSGLPEGIFDDTTE